MVQSFPKEYSATQLDVFEEEEASAPAEFFAESLVPNQDEEGSPEASSGDE